MASALKKIDALVKTLEATDQPIPTTCNLIRIKAMPKTYPDINEHFEYLKDQPLDTNFAPNSGQLLIEPEYVSVDPYQRFWMEQFAHSESKQMVSFTVAKVLKSESSQFKAGDYVYGTFPWTDKQVITEKEVLSPVPPNLSKYDPEADPDYKPEFWAEDESKFDQNDIQVPHSYYVGSYGMPGQTAYYGLVYKAQVKKGQNVLVSGAAGAVGSIVGQIAKNVFDCYTVGVAGSPQKIDWITKELGFDHGINYKEYGDDYLKVQAVLKEKFPNGIDVYFDNVGGVFTEAAWDILNPGAVVIICGQITIYNQDRENPKLIRPCLHKLIYKEIRVLGIIVSNFKNKDKFYYDMARWISSGKIQVKDTIVPGFNKLPEAFIGLFSGKNIGKMVVQCS